MTAFDSPSASPASVANAHAEKILSAAAETIGCQTSELQLLPEESFKGEGEPDAYGFMLLHATGMYGVYANLRDGTLQNVRCVKV